MNCPKCSTFNDEKNAFCVSCGEVFRSSQTLPPTLLPNFSDTETPTEVISKGQNEQKDYLSEPTVFGGQRVNINQPSPDFNASQAQFNQPPPVNFQPSMANFNPSIPYVVPSPPPKSYLGLWVGIGVFLILLLGGGIIGAILLINKSKATKEVLPDHLGMFFQNAEKTSVEEIKKQDFTNGFEGKDKILKDDSVPALESKPNFILYSDGKDIPLGDLKLIQLDTVKTDGTMKQLDFKATPVEGKPEMKRLWFSDGLANGKYAFSILDGFFDDGKHKFWAFQVKNSDRSDNNNLLKDLTVSVKNKSSSKNSNTSDNTNAVKPTPKPTVEQPVGSRTAYAGTNNLVIRNAPGLGAGKVGNLRRGQKIYVLGYSDNTDYWNGLEGKWANIQTETGQRGWVFSPLINY